MLIIILSLQVRLKGVHVQSFARVAICTEFPKFGKRSIVVEMRCHNEPNLQNKKYMQE